ncbi:MAG: VWA domain-containing protein [Planctomycetes bacterium]|nr:VWA domain-containing protein [Planctomycetota bacterium]
MPAPKIELFPLRPAVRTDAPVTLDVLVRITPPAVEARGARPALNLGLVIDRSGSMQGAKIAYAREAAAFAVKELAATDRVALTVFDDHIDTTFPSAPAADRARLLELIERIVPGGSTALHGGWAEGAKQVGDNLVPGGLNRVLLLSDGLANVGESRPDAIATDVHARAAGGVTTTTIGLGNDYNEDLLEAMARAGDGNYYYVESPAMLPALFAAELQGLTATTGTDVTLAVEPGPGVTGPDVLNELDATEDGRVRLPNLVAGFPVLVVLRFVVPPATGEQRVCALRLEWAAPGETARGTATAGLVLPAVPGAAYDALAPDLEVQERAALLAVARLKKQATRALERHEVAEARRLLAEARAVLVALAPTAEVTAELQSISEIDAQIERGDFAGSAKRAKHEAYLRHSSKPYARPDNQS